MKILMLGSGSYNSILSRLRLVAIAKLLAQRDYDIRLVLPSADKYNNFTPDKTANIPGITLVQPWQLTTKNVLVNLLPYLLTALAACLRVRPQLIFIDKPTPISIIGLVPKLLYRAPVVLDLDDLGSEVMRLQGQPALQVKLVALCERLALRHADAVVVASTYLESLVRTKYPDKPVLVLSNGVDPDIYKVVLAQSVRPAVYYYGAINRISLIETFIRALPAVVRQVPDVRVSILGDGSARAQAERLAASLGVTKSITFVGWTEAEDLPKYVQEGDIAVCIQPDIPTVRAASIMKVFQYMALGSVPVVSNVGDLPKYVKAGQGRKEVGVVVPPDNPEELARVLAALLKDARGRHAFARKAREAAETDYALSTLTGKLDAFLRTQLDHPSLTNHTAESKHA